MSLLAPLGRAVRSTVRYKLLVLALVPVVLVLPVALAIAAAAGVQFTYEQLFIKVNTDLAVAHDLFLRIKADYLGRLERLSGSHALRTALQRDDRAALARVLEDAERDGRFHYLVAHPAPSARPKPDVQIRILSNAELAGIDPALAEAVRLPLVSTPRARPSDRRIEDRGMMIHATYPVTEPSGRVKAVLEGGVLLNNNFAFVDAIRDLVYGPGSLPEGSIGTVTVFLDDVRISTNVPRDGGQRALGTRVSNEVRTDVLDQGKRWVDRAFVVNDWYISAYEPIEDAAGRRVGMLYAGYLEAPYRAALWKGLGLLVLLIAALAALYSVLAIRGAKSIFAPLEKMLRVVRATRAGYPERIGTLESEDEIAELAREFDAMLDRLEQRTDDVRRAADQLEEKVSRRTVELERRNAELRRTIQVLRDTRRKLVFAEKLAALGELTAGVAHEINNPTQVMLGNLDILTRELGEKLEPVRDEVELVIDQIYRIQEIIDKLLKYARPSEFAGYLGEVDVNDLVRATVPLIEHLHRRYDFELVLALDATRTIQINGHELQQVLVNLIGNAIQALPHAGGRVRVTTADWGAQGVEISVADNGCGMDEWEAARVFNPFYTTKSEDRGTGLGLSVSYGLVRRYGGDITVESVPGKGSTFKVRLLAEPVLVEDAETLAEQLHAIEWPHTDNEAHP